MLFKKYQASISRLLLDDIITQSSCIFLRERRYLFLVVKILGLLSLRLH